MKATQHKIQLPYTAAANGAGLPGQQQAVARSLEFPLWWHAPFVAESGLGAEAIMMIESLIATRQMRADDIYITHSGDAFDHKVLRSFSAATRNMLAHRQHPQQVADEWMELLFPAQKETQLQRLADMHDTRKAIAVCHNWFDCWRRAGEMPSNMPGCPCPLSLNRTAFTVARTMFETAGLPAHLADHVKAMDEVWVPTLFNKETFTKAGVDPAKIRVVPEAIDTDLWDPARYSPANLTRLGLVQATGPPAGPNASLPDAAMLRGKLPASGQKKPYVFLAVFKWEARKGWKDLIQGFTAAFKPSDNAVLWILARPFMESGTDFDQKVRRFAASLHNFSEAQVSSRLPRIYTSARHLSEEDFVRVYKAADVLVIPTHGEGWGRPQLEAMAMGLPVITTNWSGPTAFMNERIAYPLAIDGLSEVRSDGDPNFFQAFIGQRWAQPSVKHLTQLLLHVYR
ncbi:hypothetical protein OEZ85_003055 [Tetradesmus obliquus]|uniref:Glycosyl transferase family 1 domain-containing protein n=1 Tax=Tetradesmus obliquus TaxID=3088 RepID=A0ABY8U4F0_TETOB|nr:hypothetical protein OEZ85_003055 [Tetradesmus obliquus]